MRKQLQITFFTIALVLIAAVTQAQITITFMVNMTHYLELHPDSISPNGVHATGNFFLTTWTPPSSTAAFTDMGGNVYSYTVSEDTLQPLTAITDAEIKFKFINSWAAGYSWGACHVDQECPPAGPCVTSGGDRILAETANGYPAFDAVYYASWDSCSDQYLAPLGIQEVQGGVASIDVLPNIVSNSATIDYILLRSGKVNITVRSFTGQVMETMTDKQQSPGEYKMNLNTDTYANGMYFVSMNINGKSIEKRFVVNR